MTYLVMFTHVYTVWMVYLCDERNFLLDLSVIIELLWVYYFLTVTDDSDEVRDPDYSELIVKHIPTRRNNVMVVNIVNADGKRIFERSYYKGS